MSKTLERTARYLRQLKENANRKRKISFAVSYKTSYAIRQHEDLTLIHATGQAKFLEIPLRMYAKTLTKMVKKGVASGLSLRDATIAAATWLMEESKKLVPVDTGALRDSASVRIVHQT